MSGDVRKCPRCRQTLPFHLFGWRNKARGWVNTVCRPCMRRDEARVRSRRKHDPVKLRRSQRSRAKARAEMARRYVDFVKGVTDARLAMLQQTGDPSPWLRRKARNQAISDLCRLHPEEYRRLLDQWRETIDREGDSGESAQ